MVNSSDLSKEIDSLKEKNSASQKTISELETRFTSDEMVLIERIRSVKYQNEEAKRLKQEIEERDKLRKEAIQKAKEYSKNGEEIIVSLVSTGTGTSK